jgi:hypothetical protein
MAQLEVRELVIKAVVVPEGAAGAGSGAGSASATNDVSPNEELIKACVEKIMDILKEKNGR